MSELYLGVDPGKSGALAIVDDAGKYVDCVRFSETENDVVVWLDKWKGNVSYAFLEKVHSMPKQGVSSSFRFGALYGFCKGILVSSGIPWEECPPQKWMKFLGCSTGGDKNVTKQFAQRLHPGVKVIHANADALLIAEYCRRMRKFLKV